MTTRRILFVTGTDTGVGKTVLTALLIRHLRLLGVKARAVKPFCSGGRDDAQLLLAAQSGLVALDEVNPWHFRAPLTPLLAARRQKVKVGLVEVLSFLKNAASKCDCLLVEGAGGLLSPLGEEYSARELIAQLRAIPVVVCPNRLGAINQVLLVHAALPQHAARSIQVVLMNPVKPDHSARSNPAILAEQIGVDRVSFLPWLDENQRSGRSPIAARVRRVLDVLVDH